jgi:hypothetical protein
MRLLPILLFLLLAPPVRADEAPRGSGQAFVNCVRQQTVRLSPSREPFDIVFEAAIMACNDARLGMNAQVPDPRFSTSMQDLARHLSILDFVETRAHLPIDHPPLK